MSLLTESTKIGDIEGTEPEGEDEVKTLIMMEPNNLQWPGDKKAEGQGGGQVGGPAGGKKVKGNNSVRSDMSLHEVSSWTESKQELKAEDKKGGGGNERVGLTAEEMEHMRNEEEAEKNNLPEKAAQVFSPIANVPTSPRYTKAFVEIESGMSPFLYSQGENYSQNGFQYESTKDMPPARCDCGCPGRDALKVGVSLMTSALFFPFLVWGGFVFLPFDAPLLDNAPLRLIYTLRCSVFAAAPIILGWLVLGVSRLRSGATQPFITEDHEEAELPEISVHQRFISDSASLFLIYFLQLVVLAMYLNQEQLKIIPLLTIVFAFGRLAYWVAAVFRSSIRGFGFGLSFLPSVVMMAANFYFIFTVEAAGSIFSLPPPPEEVPPPPASRQRFWG